MVTTSLRLASFYHQSRTQDRRCAISAHNSLSQLNQETAPQFGKWIGRGTTVPSDGAKGWAPGAIFVHIDGSDGQNLYCNEGTNSSADFNAWMTDQGAQTITGDKTFSGTSTFSGAVTMTSTLTRTGRKIMCQRAKVGATSGGVVNAGDNKNSAARVPASQTAATLVFIVEGIPQGATVTAIAVIGQVESAGGSVTVDAALRKQTTAAADLTDAAVTDGAITQVAVTADTALSAANAGKTGIAEVIGDDETLYVLVTITTAASTDVDLQGILVTFTDA